MTPGDERQADLTPLLLSLAASILLLQRFWLFAKVPWIMPIVGLTLLTAYGRRSVTLRSDRLLTFLGLGSLALMTTLLNGCLGNVFSLKSMAYLLATYCLFVAVPTAPRNQILLLQVWQALSLLCALLGILQFVTFLTTQQVLDVLELLPASVIENTGYNTIHFDRTHTFLRANGMIFLEASFFSQFMALALVIEATFLGNPYRLGCFLVALLCALSGTGILMVGVALLVSALLHPASLTQRRVVIPLTGGILVFLVITLLVPDLRQYFVERAASEFTVEANDTSFYIRFLAPWVAIYRLCVLGIAKVLLGLGPGLFTVEKLQMPILPNLNPISQVAVYYGLFTTVGYLVFLWTVSIQRYTRAQWVVMLTVLFQYLFCAGNLLAPHIAYVLLWFGLVFYPSPPPPGHARGVPGGSLGRAGPSPVFSMNDWAR
jgi:hypothetical protein